MSAATPSVVFVNRFYWPEEPATAQLLTDLAEALTAHDFRVKVIASRPRASKLPDEGVHNGVAILRVGGIRRARKNLLGKLWDFIGYSRSVCRELTTCTQSGDTVVTMTDPPLLGLATSRIAQRRGLHSIHWVQDIFPEVAAATLGLRVSMLTRRWRDRAWASADFCIAPGDDMANFIRSRGVPAERVHVLPNWAPEGLSPRSSTSELRQSLGLGDKFVVAYSGNLGRVHDLDAIVALATQRREDLSIVFVFIGDGAQRRRIEGACEAQRLPNVRFLPPQARRDLADTLAIGDVHLVTLKSGCEKLVFPSKLYGIAAAARPILCIGNPASEISRLVETQGMGKAFERSDLDGMSAFLQELRADPVGRANYGEASKRFWTEHGRLSGVLPGWISLLRPENPTLASGPGAAFPKHSPLTHRLLL